MFTQPIRIAILGAGPAGLLLARIIARTKVPRHPFTITLFERDPSPASPLHRPQGGSLDLHVSSGQLGIHEAGLWPQFLRRARYDAQGYKLADSEGKVLMAADDGVDREKPEIGRAELRELLLEGIGGGDVEVRFGAKVEKVGEVEGGEGRFEVRCESVEEGSRRVFDLVVGPMG
jgi:2-polyprenyl-6-methoxyphenol hydroxylase-like FAD-dependent oxidoreductase